MSSNPIADTMLVIFSALLALAPQIIPGFKEWWDRLQPAHKQLIQVGIIVLVGLAFFGLSCAGWLAILIPGLPINCSVVGFVEVVRSILIAIAINQGVYAGTNRMFNDKGNG